MNLKQECLKIRELGLVSGQTLFIKQECENEHDGVFDEFGTNTLRPVQNIGEIKQEIIECEDHNIEQRSGLPQKIEQICSTTIKKEPINTLVENTDINDIKEDINEYFVSKADLLTLHCDLPALKNENTEYPDCLAESCDWEQHESISKDFPASVSKSNHVDGHFRDHLVICKFCGKSMKEINLRRHLMIHTNKKLLECNFCLKKFTKKSRLNTHLLSHTNEKPFKCEICLKGFNQKSHLREHLIIHTNEKPFKCSICAKGFNYKFSFQEHLLTHTNEKPFKCKICSRKYIHRSSLQKHLTTHTNEKRFKCDFCSKGFIHRYVLQRHLLIHNNEKSFKCDICSRGFNDKSSLRNHLLTHTNEKPFKCHICSKGFNHKSNLQKHLITHTSENPFNCDICFKGFNQKSNLKKHLKKSHNNEK